MCDYSLCGIPNRLAIEGEELVVHRFRTGSVGLASRVDLQECERLKAVITGKTFWRRLKGYVRDFIDADRFATAPAVCIPPGADLIVRGIPADLQKRCRVSQAEPAVFTQISAEVNQYRDAVLFHNGCQVRLQDLRVGMHVQVRSLSGSTESLHPALTGDSLFP